RYDTTCDRTRRGAVANSPGTRCKQQHDKETACTYDYPTHTTEKKLIHCYTPFLSVFDDIFLHGFTLLTIIPAFFGERYVVEHISIVNCYTKCAAVDVRMSPLLPSACLPCSA